MKGMIIKDCLDCPLSEIKNPDNNGGELICGNSIREHSSLICRMETHNYKIPIWCPLTDLQEIVDVAYFDYDMKCRIKK